MILVLLPFFEIVWLPEENPVGEPSKATSKAKDCQHTWRKLSLIPRICHSFYCSSSSLQQKKTKTITLSTGECLLHQVARSKAPRLLFLAALAALYLTLVSGWVSEWVPL